LARWPSAVGEIREPWRPLGGGAGHRAFYHLANPHFLTFHYEEADVVQIAVFVAVGAISHRCTTCAHMSTSDDGLSLAFDERDG
jgi:hypothetical protein